MRQFGIIASSIWRSKRFRSLSTNAARLTYIYLHTNTHGNSLGCFVLPPEMAALDLRMPAEDVREAFTELGACDLIRRDEDEELIQITNFFKFNSPSSRKQLAGPLRFIREGLPSSWVRDAVGADLVVTMYERAMTWDNGVEARGVFLQEAHNLVRELRLESRLVSPEAGLSKDLQIALSEALLIELPIQQTLTLTEHNTTTDTHTTTTTTQDRHPAGTDESRSAQGRPPSSAGGGRSGGRQTPQDIQDTIDSMSKR